MAPKAFGGRRTLSERERSELFVARRNRQARLDWTAIDPVELLTALTVAMMEGATVSFAPAQGGIGVTLRVYRGNYADTEFAGSSEELQELLGILIDGLDQGAEDSREVVKSRMQLRAQAT